MKKIFYLPIALLIFEITSCSTQNNKVDDTQVTTGDTTTEKNMYAAMSINDTIRTGDSVLLKFTVYNPTDSAKKFLKWQTPFEPLLSKYLDIKDEQGQEVEYKGAMAKRMMPPPADAYITLNAKDSLTAKVDILKGYALSKPGKYTIEYTSESISSLKANKTVAFIYK
ncbi:protease [Mucilaginibacter calamicampi]|uniref:Protease n=1 Tax=Mucilaginibacter calamicampi TaxID=1302352 RepID=A0ABW2YZF1_9SPHI